MKLIKNNLYYSVSGGNPLVIGAEAAMVGAGLYTAPHILYDATIFLNDIGSSVGEWTFDKTHPNVIGQMEFGPAGFGYSYIAPSFPDSYFS